MAAGETQEMSGRLSQSRRESIVCGGLGILATAAGGLVVGGSEQRPLGGKGKRLVMRGPLFNQDSTEFFCTHAADEMSGEAVDAWVDSLAEAGVGTLISNVCAMRANYDSQVWEPDWHGYDPNGPDDQPVLRYTPEGDVAGTRRRLDSARRLAELGINFHERAFARCKQHGIGCWASIRMNDVHDCDREDSPLLSTFYKEQRAQGLLRVPHHLASWQDRALDWGRAEVREHYMTLVREVLQFEGIEGLELDWMRFGYHFRIGRELEGGQVLTEWIAEVRRLCSEAGRRTGYPVRLGVRVPSTPETARNLGLDAVAWARAGLVDLVVVTPFWATCEFNMPMVTWKRLLEGTGAALAGGLEVLYRPWPGAEATLMTPELAVGAATAVLAGGADFVYLFNYFASMHLGGVWPKEEYNRTVRAMGDLAELAKLPRRHAVTYRDTLAPGEPPDYPLPATGPVCAFRLQTGPQPSGRPVEVLLELQAEGHPAAPEVWVNSVRCPVPRRQAPSIFVCRVPPEALANEAQVIEVMTTDGKPVTVVRVEVAVGT